MGFYIFLLGKERYSLLNKRTEDYEKEGSVMKILAVDDEQFIRRMLSITLKAKNYDVFLARNASEAVSMAIKEKPDVILLDIMMPGKDGFYALSKLKENEETAPIPVIMLTSLGRTRDVNRALEMGAENYVMKPFEYEDLLAVIEEVTNKSDE